MLVFRNVGFYPNLGKKVGTWSEMGTKGGFLQAPLPPGRVPFNSRSTQVGINLSLAWKLFCHLLVPTKEKAIRLVVEDAGTVTNERCSMLFKAYCIVLKYFLEDLQGALTT